MLEMILRFIGYTAIPHDTFGRLTVNDPRLIEKLRKGLILSDDAERQILSFMHHYEDAKS